MEIRNATRDDVAAVVRLLAADQLGAQREDADGPLDPAYLDGFAAIDEDANNRLVVLVDGDEVIGALQLTFIPSLTFRGGWRAQIEAVRVAADRRGSGAGRRMLQWAIDTARDHGCFLVQLTTNTQRRDARRFYESLGFTATHLGMKLYLTGDVTGR
ncbi:MAG: GNAT family N-acetyltransferase [Actinobacteria bacterium]|nr:GNAT family N-acetyltransferase [Actinomycetota bacterium]